MKATILPITAVVAIGAVIVVLLASCQQDDAPGTVTQQEQPQREKYQPPEWVTNERGQRCIKQGTTITCG
jgi:hypothetical protein